MARFLSYLNHEQVVLYQIFKDQESTLPTQIFTAKQ